MEQLWHHQITGFSAILDFGFCSTRSQGLLFMVALLMQKEVAFGLAGMLEKIVHQELGYATY
jgi:hypothetical protein